MEPQEISIETAKTLLEHSLVIDVRETDAWDSGRLPHAIHLHRDIIEQNIQSHAPDKNTPIIIYCGGGSRSLRVTDSLTNLGYKQVKSMKGGFRGWKAAGFPVVMD